MNKKGEVNLLVFDPSRYVSPPELRLRSLNSRSPSANQRRKFDELHSRSTHIFLRHPQPQKISSVLFSSQLSIGLTSQESWKARKRRGSNTLFDAHGKERKRIRGELENTSSNSDHDTIVIDDEHEKLQESLDATEVVGFFRVSQKKLG